MFTLYIVFHRNEEFHDDNRTSVQIDTEEIVNEIVEQLEETEGAQQQVYEVSMLITVVPALESYYSSSSMQCWNHNQLQF